MAKTTTKTDTPKKGRAPLAIRLNEDALRAIELEAARQTKQRQAVDPTAKVGKHEVGRQIIERWAREYLASGAYAR